VNVLRNICDMEVTDIYIKIIDCEKNRKSKQLFCLISDIGDISSFYLDDAGFSM
jgi:hypothetical protein